MKRWMNIDGKRVKVFQTSETRRAYHKKYNKGRMNGLKKYGISKETFDEMLENQNNCCFICNKIFNQTAHVDHCHRTGKVRGLLCRHCNMLLGFAGDSKKILKYAISYLEMFESK